MAGEPIPQGYVRQLELGRIAVRNLYGPTEDTTYSTSYRIGAGDRLLIGRPISNTEVYIVNARDQLQPVGVVGELCIGGSGLARGYLGREELTAEKFVANPFRVGERMYRTGDLGKWDGEGNLVFIGRKDHQVKLRGYRIELGEIEKAVEGYAGVSASVVVVRGEELVCYVVSGSAVEAVSMRQYLSERLPGYMVPHRFVRLEAMPLTPNGKIDRKQLPEAGGEVALGVEYVAPRTEVERVLVGVYEEVLKRKPIGIREDFFVLGGDSIKSIQIVSRLRERGYGLTIRDVLQYPAIGQLVDRVGKIVRRIPQEEVRGPVGLGPIQRAFLTDGREGKGHYNQSVLLYIGKGLSPAVLQQSLERLVEHHDGLRMVYRERDGVWEQENREYTGYSGLELRDYREERFGLECDAIQGSFELDRGPLFRAVLFRGGEGDRLLLVGHHLVVDGVSWRILLEDLGALYGQLGSGGRYCRRRPTRSNTGSSGCRRMRRVWS